jgi:uncharacterized RDD family membrane protein YckC
MRPDCAGPWPLFGQFQLGPKLDSYRPVSEAASMRCPACGAFYEERSARCPECGAIQDVSSTNPSQQAQYDQPIMSEEIAPVKNTQKRQTSRRNDQSLIEFPGVNRSALPEWRKELGERVREKQERRVREATLEVGIEPLFNEHEPKTAPLLELLPQTEPPPLNPLVVNALRRIERAHSQPAGNGFGATAMAYEEQPEFGIDVALAEDPAPEIRPEKVHNLAVVPTPPVIASEIPQEPRKPRRIIDDINDPALNYLDSIPTSLTVETREYRSAPLYLRMLAAIVDLLVVSFFSSPVLAFTELTNLDWRNPRVIAFAVGTFMVVGFLYLTVSVAFTGRTLGLKLFSLRVVDARTGLIPTGSQSAGRALFYMLSLATAGVILMYAFVDSEKHAAHDRFTHTAVIRV